jgi:hypothetical protein
LRANALSPDNGDSNSGTIGIRGSYANGSYSALEMRETGCTHDPKLTLAICKSGRSGTFEITSQKWSVRQFGKLAGSRSFGQELFVELYKELDAFVKVCKLL